MRHSDAGSHLMKLEHSPTIDPRTDWMDTIGPARVNIEYLLEDSPSLRGELGPMIEKQKPRVARLPSASLFGYGETVKQLPLPSYTAEQVVGDRFPWEAPLPGGGEREELA
jgi:hypothetical protein